jgi:hypothetical protein
VLWYTWKENLGGRQSNLIVNKHDNRLDQHGQLGYQQQHFGIRLVMMSYVQATQTMEFIDFARLETLGVLQALGSWDLEQRWLSYINQVNHWFSESVKSDKLPFTMCHLAFHLTTDVQHNRPCVCWWYQDHQHYHDTRWQYSIIGMEDRLCRHEPGV